ncbi:MAG TPA: energy transducer TonB [Pyrinomonadaceae bacterium]|nr:energy transducer TonB [Pyrinomonadaceae bacterium]
MSIQRNGRASSLARALACVVMLAAAAGAGHAASTPHAPPTAATNARASKGPLTKSYLLGALRRGRPRKSELVRLVKRRGVSFELTDKDERQLRAAGATLELLETLRDNYRPPGGIPPVLVATPHPPAISTIRADPVLIPPGEGGGVGLGPGSGTGPGRGGGVGPGTGSGGGTGHTDKAAHPDTFTPSEVTKKAVIISKPEPGYTEEARKNNTSGTVRLRVILTASGEVTNITVVKGLPDGLSEKAIAAARQMRFKPAEKDGRAVSQWALIEYNFYIY